MTTPVTVQSAHQMLVAIGVMSAFVMVAVVAAGTDPMLGKGILTVMFLLLLLQGMGHVSTVSSWTTAHPLTPTK